MEYAADGIRAMPEEVGEVVAAVSADTWSIVNGAYIPVGGGYLSR